jgi:hypothetical protein
MAQRISHANVGKILTILFTAEGKKSNWILTGFYGVTNVPESWSANFSRASLNPGEYGQSFQATRKNGRWVCGDQIIRSI